MYIDVETKTIQQIDIEPAEAFRILCKTLYMDCVLDEYSKYEIRKSEYDDDERCVYLNGERYDDRGDLFAALRKVATLIFPNVAFRGENYD
jgi:hypothetical protein